MKTLTLQHIKEIIFKTTFRFPLAILTMISATAASLYFIHVAKDFENPKTLINIICALVVGLPLHFAFQMRNENTSKGKILRYALPMMGCLIHVLLFAFIYQMDISNPSDGLALLSIYILVHLFASYIPLFAARNATSFWAFNQYLLSVFLSSTFFSIIIWGGLSLAYTAISMLLSKEMIPNTLYADTFIVIVGIFHTYYFLSRIPANAQWDILFNNEYMDRLIRWILSPLVLIYLIILYLYLGKIIVSGQLPEGWVSIWILLFSIMGILTWLLAFPILQSEKSGKLLAWAKYFYILLLPLIGLLWWAILYRVLEYGITEPRSVILYLAIWLSFVVLYYTFGNRRNIQIIPISLFITAFLFTFGGPVNYRNISFKSQISRWNTMLETPSDFSIQTAKNQLDYFNQWHYDKIDIWGTPLPINEDLNLISSRYERLLLLEASLDSLNLNFKADSIEVQAAEVRSEYRNLLFHEFEISGYEYLIDGVSSTSSTTANFNGETFEFSLQIRDNGSWMIKRGEMNAIEVDIRTALEQYRHEHEIKIKSSSADIPRFMLAAKDEKYEYRFLADQLSFDDIKEGEIYTISGIIILKKR